MNLHHIFEAKYAGLNLKGAWFVTISIGIGGNALVGGPFRTHQEAIDWLYELDEKVQELDGEGRDLQMYDVSATISKMETPRRRNRASSCLH